MHIRIAMIMISLVLPVLLLVSCNDEQPNPRITQTPRMSVALVPTVPEQLTQEIPPCTPAPRASADPCDPDVLPFETDDAHYIPELGGEPRGIQLDDGQPPAWVGHIAMRGTYLPGTTRCTAGDLFFPPSYLRNEFGDSSAERSFKCYIDVRANAYVLGAGPSILTVMLLRHTYWDGWYTPDGEDGQTEQDIIEEMRQDLETDVSDFFSGQEHILFLGPAVDLSSETWRVMEYWNVERREDGTVIAVHPDRDLWRRLRPDEYGTHVSKLEMELPDFTQAVTMLHEARVADYGGRIGTDESLPMLVNDANELREFYTDIGAYDHPEGPPAQPPPPCGLAVPNQSHNPGLVRDCIVLLGLRDGLRGSGALNWSVERPITDWEGVRVQGSPSRVRRLELVERGLTGTVPPELGNLSRLEVLLLGDNSFSGCIPAGLRDVDEHDLGRVGLPYCSAP